MKLSKVAAGHLSLLVEKAIKDRSAVPNPPNLSNVPGSAAPTRSPSEPSSGERIMLIGDSLARGLTGQMKYYADSKGIPFIGKGIESTHVSQWVNNSWLSENLSSFKPTIVLISLGTNDAFSNVDVKSFEANVESLLNKVKSAGAKPIWIGNPKLPSKGLTGAPLRPEILKTIQEKVPFYIRSDELNITQPDSIHPNSGGYGMWAGTIWSSLNNNTEPQTAQQNDKPTVPEKIFQNYKITQVSGVNTAECGIMVPDNPVKPDGSIDFIFAFKAFGSSNTAVAKSFGVNAVVVSLFVGDYGDQKHLQYVKSFSSPGGSGPANYITYIRQQVISQIKEQMPDKNIKPGKLLLLWWSGGFSAAAAVLKERNNIPGGIDSAISLDGMWGSNQDTMSTFQDFAEEAKQDSSKKFFVVYSNCPANYRSANQNAQQLAEKAGVKFQPVTGWKGEDIRFNKQNETLVPKSVAAAGGLHVVNLFGDDQANPADQHTKTNLWGQKNLITYALS